MYKFYASYLQMYGKYFMCPNSKYIYISVNFDNPTKRKYAIARYQMFLWIFDKMFRENAKNRHFLAQNVQIDNDFW